MNVVSAIVVVVLCGWVGRTLRVPLTATDEPSRPFRLLLYALTGAGLLLLWLLALDFFGVRWNGVSAIAIPALIAAAISAAVVRRFDARRLGTQRFETQHAAQPRLDRRVLPLGWGDALALYTIVVLVLLLGEPCLTMSDFLFHWGFKAQRFWLDGGIDIGFLSRPWNFLRHPDYPQLVPSLFTMTALVRGAFTVPAMIIFSAIFVAGTAIAAREGLARAGVDRHLAQGGVAIIVMTSTMATINLRLGGSPDLLMALLMTTGAALYLAPVGPPSRDLQIGIVAAVAIGAKIEGVVFAALLVGGHLLRRWHATGFPSVRIVARACLPSALIAVPWGLTVLRHDLMHSDRAGQLRLDQLGVIVDELHKTLLHPGWSGLSWCILALPVLLLLRTTRLPALLIVGQAAFYGWVYITTTADPATLIRTSAVRLVLHVLAPTQLLIFVALDRMCRPSRDAGTIRP